ncbi:MAG TPA: hypothetical protein VMV29_12640 [Ktedonobacterales bacterium]|nr:hypothetical protein [Ktedonobacterales bacterium]
MSERRQSHGALAGGDDAATSSMTGAEVIYATPAPQDAPDAEPSPTRLIWDPLRGEYLAQSPGRMRRREGTDECPFCADLTQGRVPPGTQAWIRPNDFPAFRPPVGECYILIYSPDHDRTFTDLTVPEVVRVIGLWRRIYADMAPRYACVMTWETSGAAIGQTQRHPHGQTYAVGITPEALMREMQAIQLAAAKGQPCPFCAAARAEAEGPRSVFVGAHWVGYVPAAARYPYQVQLVTRAHINAITDLPTGEADAELADALLRLVRAYNRAFQAPMPYMLALHQLADERFHLHIELLPVGRAPGKLKIPASSEMAWGFWLNDSLPEAKAAELRALLAEEAR